MVKFQIVAAAFVLLFVFPATAQPLIDFGEYKNISHQRPCFSGSFGEYTTWRDTLINRNPNYKTEDDRKKARLRFGQDFPREQYNYFKKNLTCNWFQYPVDGGKVNGYIIRKNLPESTKLPVLVYNRGGNGNYGGMVFGALFKRLFPIADRGFVIIGSQYRGTFMKEPDASFDDQFGGEDVNDVVELFKLIPHIDGVDNDHVGMFGGSRGGMQTFLALKAGVNVEAVAVLAAPTDLLAGLTDRPEMENVYKHRIPDYESNKQKALGARSVVAWVDKLDKRIPMLVLHGQNDKRVSANQSLALANVLQQHNHPYKLIIYPGDDHGLNGHRDEVNNELVDWFKQHFLETTDD